MRKMGSNSSKPEKNIMGKESQSIWLHPIFMRLTWQAKRNYHTLPFRIELLRYSKMRCFTARPLNGVKI